MAESPKIARKAPFVLEIEPGTYVWCACGRSESQPYCDGSHRGTGILPVVENIEEKRAVAWCGCKRTKSPPYCDGTHGSLPV